MSRNRKNKQDEIDRKIAEAGPDHAYHAMDTGEVLEKLDVNPTLGLDDKEIAYRVEKYGLNVLVEKDKTNLILLFLGQFFDILIGLLFIAAIVSIIFEEYVEAAVIFAIVIVNGLIGFIQEYQAEKSLEELKKMVSKEVRVIRNGDEHVIDSTNLVVGDIVLIEAGEKVPADMRLLESTSLKVDESALTGESISLSKSPKQLIAVNAVIGDRRNMLFMGTTVTYGRAKAIVVDTGMETEMGKIAALMQSEKEEPTPLQKNLDKLGKVLGLTIIIICAIVFGATILHEVAVLHEIEIDHVVEALENAIALAVSAIPEGLPAAITLTYAIGVRMMAKQNAIISRLPAVETLGIVDVICSDKTGTLTKNEMTVVEVRTLNHQIKITGEGYKPIGQFIEDGKVVDPLRLPDIEKMARVSLLCNNSIVHFNKETDDIEIIGDPTEVSLMVLARKAGMFDEKLYKREAEIFFDSQRKRMTTINRFSNSKEFEEDLIAYSKGSPPVLLEHCSFISIDGKVSPLSDGVKEKILEMNDEMASRALRVLALAYRVVDERLIKVDKEDFLSELEANIETDLVFLGLLGLIDPARPEVKGALLRCRTAGIEAVMVTGDQKITAEAIAKDIGLIQGDKWKTVTGVELEAMSDEELSDIIEDVSIFARVSPEHKHRIVSMFQEKGHVVATTGDGVNDAPAIKKADIGIAMGIQGTDVTREAAQMVLADDNFATIVTAVERGRTIFQNMLKFIRYLIASNFDEILTVFVCVVFLGLGSPYTAIQILWINLVTDGLPAIALSVDPPFEGIMREPPRKKNEGFMKDIYIFSIIAGLLAFSASMIVFVPLAYVGEANIIDVTVITDLDEQIAAVNAALDTTPTWMKNFALIFTKETNLNHYTGGVSSDVWYSYGQTLNFTMSVLFEMFNVFITRSGFERTTLRMNPFNNKWLWMSVGLALSLQMVAIYVPMKPEFGINNTVFNSMPIGLYDWLLVIGICVIAALLMELAKFLVGKYILKHWIGQGPKSKIEPAK